LRTPTNLRDRGAAAAIELRIDEARVEARIVDDERRIADEGEQVVDDIGEQRLVGEEFGREAVHPEGLLGHVALRIDVTVKRLPGRNRVEQLDAADLNQPIAAQGIEAGRFGIEHDLAHIAHSLVIARRVSAEAIPFHASGLLRRPTASSQ
jgi:hypothetical protein